MDPYHPRLTILRLAQKDPAIPQIHIAPSQAYELTCASGGGQREDGEGVELRVLCRLDQQPLALIFG